MSGSSEVVFHGKCENLSTSLCYISTSLVQRIDQSLSYAIENELTTEKNYEEGVSNNQKTRRSR